ncbi:MAG: lysylphosphatidylglycerol synthase transmembrane domain-containing protein [Candidatus Thorarchaeota archaeon]
MAEAEEVATMIENNEASQQKESSFINLRHLVVFVMVAIIIYLAIFFYSKYDEVAAAIATIEWWWVFPAMMVLSFLNYIFRYFKWQYYLGRIGVSLSHADSFSIFLAGFTLTASPGKIGEAIKGYFINELDGTPIAKTVPVVVSERVTDLLAMILLALVGFALGVSAADQILTLILLGGVVLVGAIFLSQPRFYNKFLKKMTSFGPLKRFQSSTDLIEDTLSSTLSPKPMMVSTGVSIPGWFMECVELWLLLSLLTGAGFPSLEPSSLNLLLISTFIHSAASVIGALVFTPGGLGGYEATALILIPALLGLTGEIGQAITGAATIIIRFVTLWFSVIVGFIALGIVTRRRNRAK